MFVETGHWFIWWCHVSWSYT